MTEVPEHLLRRSRERRKAASGESDAAEPEQTPAAASSAPAPAAPKPAAASSASPAPPSQAPPPPPPPQPKGTGHRSGIPVWVMPVLLALPLWAVVYVGSFGERGGDEGPVDVGAQVYGRNCASCHGATGGGVGNFPALSGGQAAQTFPDEADHIAWVEEGSRNIAGQPYGAAGAIATGGMPGFASVLSPEQIAAVVEFERNSL